MPVRCDGTQSYLMALVLLRIDTHASIHTREGVHNLAMKFTPLLNKDNSIEWFCYVVLVHSSLTLVKYYKSGQLVQQTSRVVYRAIGYWVTLGEKPDPCFFSFGRCQTPNNVRGQCVVGAITEHK